MNLSKIAIHYPTKNLNENLQPNDRGIPMLIVLPKLSHWFRSDAIRKYSDLHRKSLGFPKINVQRFPKISNWLICRRPKISNTLRDVLKFKEMHFFVYFRGPSKAST